MAESAQDSSHHGDVVAVRGSVVDVRFEDRLPMVNTILRAGAKKEIAIEVLEQLDRQLVRGVDADAGPGSTHESGEHG